MNKLLKTAFILLIILLTIVSYSYGQEAGAARYRPDYRTVAVAVDPLQSLLFHLMGDDAIFLGGNVELAVTSHISLQLDLAYVSVSGVNGFQVGGGGRYYYTGKGVNGGWAGGYLDFFTVGEKSGLETALLSGYKFILGPLFIDPFIGFRLAIPEASVYRFGVNAGLTF